MTIVDRFMEQEQKNRHWVDKLLLNYPEFTFASDFGLTPKDYIVKPQITIRPSILRKLLFGAFLVFAFYFWIITFLLVINNKLLPITICFLLLVSSLIGFVVWRFFLSPKYIYTIRMDKDQLHIGKMSLPWDRVAEVMIMTKGSGRSMEMSLVVFDKDDQVHRYSLENFNLSNKLFFRQVEGFRRQGMLPA